ncbi:nucleoside diphosphate kinase regulator [Desulfotomaculum defluvii]
MESVRKIYMTNVDKERLQKLIAKEKEVRWNMGKEYLSGLERELERALLVSSQEVPPSVITMNSKVLLEDLSTGEEMTYTLVYPEEADVLEDKISVLAPVGTAILGYQVGDILDWPVPDGIVRLRVKEILYQPEAAGNFEL